MRLLILGLVLVLAVASASVASAWEPPADCEPEQRQSPGNTNTPCRVMFPESQGIMEYRIDKHYPVCVETMRIHLPGMQTTGKSEITFGRLYYGGYISSEIWDWFGWDYMDEHLIVYGLEWGLASSISHSAFGNPDELRPDLYLSPNAIGSNAIKLSRPRTDNVAALVSACLALVQQEKDDIEHAEQLAQEEADAAAQRAAERDATIKEQEQAIREEESRVRVAQEEIEAFREQQRLVAETEIIKTRTLRDQLLHEEAVAEILQDIARIRLAGQEDRARLTNEYLIRAEASARAFNEEVEEIRRTIQDYLDFNSDLLEQLDKYKENIAEHLREVEAELEEQQARIEELNATREPELPTVTPSS